MSSDCDDDRLLIDDHNDISVNEGETGNKTTSEKDAANEVGDVSREEGELVDEEMEQSESDPNSMKTKSENPKIEKRPPTPKQDGPTQKKMRVKSTPSPLPPPPIPPILKHDKSTCVQTRAVQNEADDSPFEMEPGSSFTVQMTVVCRLENANTLYVTTKWKDQELSGVLTDGVPPGFQNLMKKSVLRSQNGTNYSNSGEGDKSGNQSTPSKKRVGRNFQSDIRRRSARPQAENNNSNEDGDEEVESNNDSRPSATNSSVAMTEIGENTKLHECPYDGCFYRFERGTEMDYHINIFHKVKAVMRESICCQTDISALRREDVATETDPVPDELTDLQKDSIKQLFMAGTSNTKTEVKEEPGKRTGSPFSDISEPDESMPKIITPDSPSNLIKPEKADGAHSNGVATVTPLTGNALLEGQVHSSVNSLMGGVNPLSSNGIFSSPLSSTNHFQNSRLPQQEHKIHQLKQEDASGSNTNLAPKPLSSPAQPRPHFSLPMAGPHSNHPLMQPSFNPQAAMQMLHLSMARGYPSATMGTACTPDQLAQIAAFQANLPGSYGNIYPK
ncbi:unnamed protein product [Auanema sp. JU1783]|nr:unnamed protein product [Auanema sp. JU1783]